MSDTLKSVVQALINENEDGARTVLHQYIVKKVQEIIGATQVQESSGTTLFIVASTRGADEDGNPVDGPIVALKIEDLSPEQVKAIKDADEFDLGTAIVDLKYNDFESDVDVDEAVISNIGTELPKYCKTVITKPVAWLASHAGLDL